jgi:hypothetical protein
LGLEIQREYHHIVTLPHPFGQFGGILILGSRQKGQKKERKAFFLLSCSKRFI